LTGIPLWRAKIRTLVGRQDFDELKAWALQIDAKDIELPSAISEVQKASWLELFKYPRSMAVTVLTSLGSQTAGNGIGLWAPTLSGVRHKTRIDRSLGR
jgi:hypothetical protein